MFLTDRLSLSTSRKYTDEGFLQVPATISRTGIQTYTAGELGLTDREPKEIIRVYRPEDEVFKPESLQSFANKPVTDNHPPELVSADNVKKYSVGVSGPEITHQDQHVHAMLNIMDSSAIRQIESGKVELSNGYTADIEWVSGVTPNGEQFDAVQRNIKGNHIAIVKRGRAGSTCRVADQSPEIEEELAMAKITVDGVDYEVSEQAAQAVGKLNSRLHDAEESAKMTEEEKKKKEDELAAEKKKADEMKAKMEDAESKIPTSDKIDEMIADRLTLIEKVKKLSPTFDHKGKDELKIMSEIVAEKCPKVQLDSASGDYIKARFDLLCDSLDQGDDLDKTFSDAVSKSSTEKNKPMRLSDSAREKFMERSQNLYKGKSGGDK